MIFKCYGIYILQGTGWMSVRESMPYNVKTEHMYVMLRDVLMHVPKAHLRDPCADRAKRQITLSSDQWSIVPSKCSRISAAPSSARPRGICFSYEA